MSDGMIERDLHLPGPVAVDNKREHNYIKRGCDFDINKEWIANCKHRRREN